MYMCIYFIYTSRSSELSMDINRGKKPPKPRGKNPETFRKKTSNIMEIADYLLY